MITRTAIFGFVFVAIVGCAAPQRSIDANCASARLPALAVASPPVEFPLAGFAITPPQGEHWCIGDQDSTKGVLYSTSALLARPLGVTPSVRAGANTLGVTAFVLDPGDWKVDTSEGLRAYAEFLVREQPGRFRNRRPMYRRNRRSAQNACADHVAEERHNPRMPNAVFILGQPAGFLPASRFASAAIVIAVSERYLQGDAGPRLLDLKKDQIEGFMQSLRFMRPQ